jgi:predicted anti-sigma-YlaC factor YlaD
MNCREFVDFLIGYIDGELGEGPSRVFEEHMRMCPPCMTYLDTYKDTIRLGKFACADENGPPPEAAPEALIQAILAARRELSD